MSELTDEDRAEILENCVAAIKEMLAANKDEQLFASSLFGFAASCAMHSGLSKDTLFVVLGTLPERGHDVG